MLRNWARLWRGLPCSVTPRNGAQDTISPMGVVHRFSHKVQGDSGAWLYAIETNKDQAVPNPSWSQEMMEQFNQYMEMTKDGSWQKLPSYRSISDYIPEGDPKPELQNDKHRLFLRCVTEEGMGFEYAMFLNLSEKRMASFFQLGPYLEGPSGYAHGGAIATILDTTLGASAFHISRWVMTANLNLNYKSPVALGSVVRVDSRVDRVEGKKIFVSGEMWSVDKQTLYVQATALFIELQPDSFLRKARDPHSSL
ncbi:acyl-coenzyme A thioesterase THEM4-like isoform X1 [Crotalus tigris]|uniref:acyl-coenzyme A thioesterase THEM4-like isoform X1 n=1 Tax=Crotalus tigris TaxID=88082 RepID=UPI00192F7E8A|nr:acyl-coenzyme A thioesterase THEM4-like isoform X1 [Crotalus tigris]XP_039219095.1 acyl-coenzyme A thioesterase THEM4-like isoform X1 [Crotalus tigris]